MIIHCVPVLIVQPVSLQATGDLREKSLTKKRYPDQQGGFFLFWYGTTITSFSMEADGFNPKNCLEEIFSGRRFSYLCPSPTYHSPRVMTQYSGFLFRIQSWLDRSLK